MQITTTGIDKMAEFTGSDLREKINSVRPKKNNVKKFIILAATMVSVVAAGIYFTGKKDTSAPTASAKGNEQPSVLSSVINKLDTISNSRSGVEFEPNETELTKKYNALQAVREAGNFKANANSSDSQIAKDISLASFDKSNYFLSLAAVAEGYRKNPYSDNKGIATGLGYNASMQTKTTNKQIFSMITKDNSVVNSAINLTGVMSMGEANPADINKIKIAPQQAAQITQMMSYVFAEPMARIIGEQAKLTSAKARAEMKEKSLTPESYGQLLLKELKSNERDTLVYHNYKVGSGGFSKYKGLIASLVEYRYNNTITQADKVASHFTYKYTLNGVVKEDTRASGLITNMFLDPQAFAYFVGKTKTYPDSLKSRIQKIHPSTIDKNAGAGEMVLADEFGNYVEELKRKGINNIKVEQRLGNADLAPYTPAAKARATTAFFGGTF